MTVRRFRRPVLFDLRYDGFVGLAERAMVCAQIKARFLRFNPGQHQGLAAFGAGRPEIVDKFEIKTICHSTASIFAGGIALRRA
jgi:hypothetical protein